MAGSMLLFSLHLPVRRRQFAGSLVLWRILQGRHRRAGDAAVADHPVRHLSAASAPHDHFGLRHGGGRRAGDRAGARRLSRRHIQLALGILRAGPGRAVLCRRAAPEHAARSAAAARSARLDRLSEPRRGDLLRAAGAVARPAAGLVRIAGNLAGDVRRRFRFLHLPRAQPDRRSGRFSTSACCSTAITRSASCWSASSAC